MSELMELPTVSLSSLGSGLCRITICSNGLIVGNGDNRTKNDTQLRPEPRELNEFHQFRESGKSDILLGRHVKER
jgi:hypothetical protein